MQQKYFWLTSWLTTTLARETPAEPVHFSLCGHALFLPGHKESGCCLERSKALGVGYYADD